MADEPLAGDPLHLYVARGDVPWEERDGSVLLAMPADERRRARWLAKLLRAPEAVSIRLDEPGTATWLLADGSRTGEEIATALAERFRGDGWPLRVKSFTLALSARGLLRFDATPLRATDALAGFPPQTGFRAVACRRCSTLVRLKGPPGAIYQCPGCGRLTRAQAP